MKRYAQQIQQTDHHFIQNTLVYSFFQNMLSICNKITKSYWDIIDLNYYLVEENKNRLRPNLHNWNYTRHSAYFYSKTKVTYFKMTCTKAWTSSFCVNGSKYKIKEQPCVAGCTRYIWSFVAMIPADFWWLLLTHLK